MSYRRGSFGIEYRPEPPSEETPWLLWTSAALVCLALVYGSFALYRKITSDDPESAYAPIDAPAAFPHSSAAAPAAFPQSGAAAPAAFPPVPVTTKAGRPRKARNLLMRLDRAIAMTNVALQVATIEELRSLPGAPVADLDDELARRLGALKLHMLFGAGMRNEWVTRVEVKRGNSASRIAAEYGTTLKCIEKLNGDVSSLRAGASLKVMNHPQFRLTVSRRRRSADLSLDGRFFKRYRLTAEVSGSDGVYVFPVKTKAFLVSHGIGLDRADAEEIDMLLTKGAELVIGE